MKFINLITALTLAIFSTTAFGYGSSSGGQKTCNKPTFTQFTPVHLATVAPQSSFSFLASSSTNPSSIQVSAKKLPVNVVIEKTTKGHKVTGILPISLKNTYARISIQATGVNRCTGSDGWLLKIN